MKEKIKKALCNVDLLICGVALCTMIFVTFIGVVMRYCFNAPIKWLEEVQLWCMVWTVYLGMGAVVRNGGHIAIEIIVELFPKKVQKVVAVLVNLLMCALLVFLITQGDALVQLMLKSKRKTALLRVSYWVVYSAMPVGCVIELILTALETVGMLKRNTPNIKLAGEGDLVK